MVWEYLLRGFNFEICQIGVWIFLNHPKVVLDFFKSPKGGLEFLHRGFGIFYFLSKGVWGTHKRGFEFPSHNRGLI